MGTMQNCPTVFNRPEHGVKLLIFCLTNEGKCMKLQGLSDKQINEIGLRYWAKASKAYGSIDAEHFIRQGMACQLELERRAKWRKMN